jgi:hypothetical protein
LAPHGAGDEAFGFGNPLRKFDLLLSPAQTYAPTTEGVGFAVAAAALLWGLRRGSVRIAPELRGAVLVCWAAFFLLPAQFLGGSGLDHRIPWAAAMLTIAATDMPRLRGAPVATALLLLVLLRTAPIVAVWREADRRYAELKPVFDQIPVGSRVAVAYQTRSLHAGAALPVPMLHIPTLAVLYRDAFVPTLFTRLGQQPVLLQPRWRALADAAPPEEIWDALYAQSHASPSLRAAFGQFDFVLLVGNRSFDLPSSRAVTPLGRTDRLVLMRVLGPLE